MSLKIMRIGFILIISLIIAVMSVTAQDDEQPVDADDDTIIIDTEQAAETVVNITETTAEGITRIVSDFLNRLFSVAQNPYIAVLMLLVGVILLVGGWRIYNYIIIIAGALVGGTIGLAAVANAGVVIEVAAFLIGAVVGGALGYFVYYFAVFMIGAYIGIVTTTLIAQSLELLPISPLVLLIFAFIGGLIMLGLSFELLVLLASLLGAQLIVVALGLTPTLVWLVLLVLLGVVLQIGLTRRAGYTIRRRPSRELLFN